MRHDTRLTYNAIAAVATAPDDSRVFWIGCRNVTMKACCCRVSAACGCVIPETCTLSTERQYFVASLWTPVGLRSSIFLLSVSLHELGCSPCLLFTPAKYGFANKKLGAYHFPWRTYYLHQSFCKGKTYLASHLTEQDITKRYLQQGRVSRK